jgi:hypothetical protein
VLTAAGNVAPVREEIHQRGAAQAIAVGLNDGHIIVIEALLQACDIHAKRLRLLHEFKRRGKLATAVIAPLGERGDGQGLQALEELLLMHGRAPRLVRMQSSIARLILQWRKSAQSAAGFPEFRQAMR